MSLSNFHRPLLRVKANDIRAYYPNLEAALRDIPASLIQDTDPVSAILQGIQENSTAYSSRWYWANEPPRPLITPGALIGGLIILEETREGRWLCLCDCGRQLEVEYDLLASETAYACGNCKLPETTIFKPEDAKKSDLYPIWEALQKSDEGKHTQIDPAWDNFSSFWHWAIGQGWRSKLCLKQIDTSKPYGPYNCQLRQLDKKNGFSPISSKPVIQKKNGQFVRLWNSRIEAAEQLLAEGSGSRSKNNRKTNTLSEINMAADGKRISRIAFGYQWYAVHES